MAVDLRYAIAPLTTLPETAVEEYEYDPTTWDTIKAQLDYSYGGLIDSFRNEARFRHLDMDLEYNPLEDIEGYEDYFDSLVFAKNRDHMAILKSQIDERNESREVLAQSSLIQNLAAGIVDPINLVALPFGGPTVGIARSLARGGAAAGLTQAAIEVPRLMTDPTATGGEAGLNITATAVFGSMISGATSIPLSRKALAFQRHEQTHKEFMEALDISEDVGNITADDIASKLNREERKYGGLKQEEVMDYIKKEEKVLFGIEENIPSLDAEIKQAQINFDIASKENISIAERIGFERELQALQSKRISLGKAQQESSEILNNLKKERSIRSFEDAQVKGVDDAFSLDSNLFIDSPFFKFVTTPFKRVLQSDISQSAKKSMLKLANDSGLAIAVNRFGKIVGPSVYQKAKLMEAEWVQTDSILKRVWGDSIGEKPKVKLGINFTDVIEHGSKIKGKFTGTDKSRTYNDFLKQANEKRINGIKGATDSEQQAIEAMNAFYKNWEDRLEDIGLLGSSGKLSDDIDYLRKKIDRLELKQAKYKSKKLKTFYKNKVARLKEEIEEKELTLETLKDYDLKPANEDVFMPRYWNISAIKKDRARLEKIIANWYSEHPYIYAKVNGKYVRQELDRDPDKIKRRAQQTVDNILGIKDVADPEVVAYGYGKSKHLRHRELDIPNKLVYDFIVQDPMAIMRTYAHKTAGVYQFYKEFGRRGIVDVLEDLEEDMLIEGKSQKDINVFRKDFKAMYDRIVGSPMSDPSRWDNKIVNVMKDFAYLNYLGSAGFSAIPDFSRIIMEHEIGDVVKGLTSILDENAMKLTKADREAANEGLDIMVGSSHLRMTEHMSNNPMQNGVWDVARNVYSIANLLGPMTVIAKELDSIVRGHTLMKLSLKLANNESISNKDVTYLARYNIDKPMAERIAKMPYQKSGRELFLANTTEWTDAEATETFRSALSSGILNTVMMGTPADKPIITDGVVYVPYKIARAFGYEEDSIVKGYSKVESGLLGLPFQFMSYSFAAMNKVTGAYSQNQVKNRMAGVFAAMGLGYLAVKIKTPDFAWEDMDTSDKFIRAFDQSGLLALYSDLMYTSISTSMALGHGNYMEGLVSAKFPQDPDAIAAFTGIMGAGPSITSDLTINPAIDFLNGDYGEGAKDFMRSLPFARLWLWKDEMNSFSLGLSRSF